MDKKKQLEKWNKTLEKIKADLTPISYDTWFKPLVFNSVDETNKIIYFEVFNALLVKVINERYLKLLETNIQEVFGEPLKVSFNIPTDTPKPKKKTKNIQRNSISIRDIHLIHLLLEITTNMLMLRQLQLPSHRQRPTTPSLYTEAQVLARHILCTP